MAGVGAVEADGGAVAIVGGRIPMGVGIGVVGGDPMGARVGLNSAAVGLSPGVGGSPMGVGDNPTGVGDNPTGAGVGLNSASVGGLPKGAGVGMAVATGAGVAFGGGVGALVVGAATHCPHTAHTNPTAIPVTESVSVGQNWLLLEPGA